MPEPGIPGLIRYADIDDAASNSDTEQIDNVNPRTLYMNNWDLKFNNLSRHCLWLLWLLSITSARNC
jgi:hypothetical protein